MRFALLTAVGDKGRKKYNEYEDGEEELDDEWIAKHEEELRDDKKAKVCQTAVRGTLTDALSQANKRFEKEGVKEGEEESESEAEAKPAPKKGKKAKKGGECASLHSMLI